VPTKPQHWNAQCPNTGASKLRVVPIFSRSYWLTGRVISWFEKSIGSAGPIDRRRSGCRSKQSRSASCPIISTRSGVFPNTTTIIQAAGVRSSRLLSRPASRCSALRQQSCKTRQRNLATAFLGTCDSRRTRSCAACGLHPLQSGKARAGAARLRLATQQLPSLCRGRQFAKGLGWRYPDDRWRVRRVRLVGTALRAFAHPTD
jgi:hypothetical protein